MMGIPQDLPLSDADRTRLNQELDSIFPVRPPDSRPASAPAHQSYSTPTPSPSTRQQRCPMWTVAARGPGGRLAPGYQVGEPAATEGRSDSDLVDRQFSSDQRTRLGPPMSPKSLHGDAGCTWPSWRPSPADDVRLEMAEHMRPSWSSTLATALRQRQPKAGMIHHSDQDGLGCPRCRSVE